MLLAIDTATRTASLAVYDANGVQAEMTWHSRENHTVELMAQIVRLLDLASVEKSNLSAIGVALGPGSFTGLRVGMSVAKGLAMGLHIPLIGIPTLDGVAHGHSFVSMPIWAVIQAGRGRYSVACYLARRGTIKRSSEYALVSPSSFADLVNRKEHAERARRVLFCGEIDAPLAQVLVERLGGQALIAPPALDTRRAGFLAELAWSRLQLGHLDDVESLAPMYTPHEI